MKLKYYLRGLGIGIVVTAVIMTVALGNKQPMTDEEVIARAKQLGMIENSVLTDIADKTVETTDDEVIDSETPNNDEEIDEETPNNEEVNDNETSNNDETVDNQADDEEMTDRENTKEDTPKDVVSITVVGGDTSWTVSKRMEEAGLIESARDFDTHLCRYGYDKRISVGTYNIPKSASHEEMAKIITKTD